MESTRPVFGDQHEVEFDIEICAGHVLVGDRSAVLDEWEARKSSPVIHSSHVTPFSRRRHAEPQGGRLYRCVTEFVHLGRIAATALRSAPDADSAGVESVRGFAVPDPSDGVPDVMQGSGEVGVRSQPVVDVLNRSGPLGPLVPAEEVGELRDGLRIETRVNGTTVQSSSTDRMIYSIGETLSRISRTFTLNPGDLAG